MSDLRSLQNHTQPVCGRQIAFFVAFLLPIGKMLEAPSLLAQYVKDDLLLPAFLHFLLQGGLLFLLLLGIAKGTQPLSARLKAVFGKWTIVWYWLYAVVFLGCAVLPLLDLEKFVYAAFSDTAPTLFTFAFFFILSAFICTKGLKSVGRCADLCLFLFVIPFSFLILMSLGEADFTHLLPLFGTEFGDTMSAFTYTTPHFFDLLLALPLLMEYQPKKGDTAKIMTGYGVSAFCTLLFLAVFFGIYSSIAPREHYAFSKIAQYFPALSVVGRIDLIFVYCFSLVLFFYTCLPLQYATQFLAKSKKQEGQVLFSVILNFLAFLFALYCNKYYNTFYSLISGKLFWLFWLFADILPLLLCLLPKGNVSPRNPAPHQSKNSKPKDVQEKEVARV